MFEKLQFSFSFSLISSLQRSLALLALLVTFLKIACLHVSFPAYENFYRLSKNALSSCLLSTFFPPVVSENQKFHTQTYIHLYTVSSIHKYICNRKCTKTLSKAPCLVALRMYLTLYLLLFAQSM